MRTLVDGIVMIAMACVTCWLSVKLLYTVAWPVDRALRAYFLVAMLSPIYLSLILTNGILIQLRRKKTRDGRNSTDSDEASIRRGEDFRNLDE